MRGWSSSRDLLAWSMARNFAYLESACARNGWSMPHENVGWNLRISTMEICWLHYEPSTWTLGTSNAALATYWKRTRGTPSNELDKQIWAVFSNKTLGWLGRTWLRMRTAGWWRWMSSWNFVQSSRACFSLIVQNFEHFVPVRALKQGCLFGMRTSDSDSMITSVVCFLFIFSSAPCWPHEGPLVQSCFTGQFPGTDCFRSGQSPHVQR